MTNETEVSWDEAITTSDEYVTLETDKDKTIEITNWKLIRAQKFGKEAVEFQADVTMEDGKNVEKKFTSVSNRLKKKLRDALTGVDASSKVKLEITPIGEKFNREYRVKLLN